MGLDWMVLFPLLLKILEWILDKSKMTREQKKAFVQFVKDSQKDPQPSVRLMNMVEAQEKELMEKLKKEAAK